jgi:hypothetical protein
MPMVGEAFQFLATGGASMIHGHTAIVLTLPLLFLITVIFISNSLRAIGAECVCTSCYRVSMTTSTSQGRRVPFFFGFCVVLCFI